jgi:hypothetical protein
MTLIASLAFLASLAVAGIALLRGFANRLTPLETIAYGPPLGAILGSLLMLLTARIVGLSAAAILVGMVALGGALVGFLVQPPGPLLRSWATQARSAAVTTMAKPIIWVPALVVGLVLIRWAIFWSGALFYTEGGVAAAHVNIFGDLPVHIGNATSFAYGDNFPPEHPRFAGTPHAYHHLSDLGAAALIPLGLDPAGALLLHSLVYSLFTGLAIFAFALRLTQDTVVSAATLALFVLGGSLGWVAMLPSFGASPDPLAGRIWAFELVRSGGFEWQNMFYGFVAPQRAFLYGLPMAFLALSLVLVGHRLASVMPFLVAGAVLGLLPLAHLTTMLSMALVTPFLVILFPSRRWVYFFVTWILVAIPQLFLQQGGGAGALSFIRVQLGWMMGDVPWPLFWFKQLGLFLPLLLVALALPRLLPRDSYRLLVAFMGIFVIANVVVFQPWDWDNHKYLVYWFYATCVLVASLLVWAWRRYGFAVRGLIAVGLVTMVLSGVLEDVNQLLGRDWFPLFTTEDIALAARVRDETPPDAIFAAAPQNNHPVPVLSGRRVVMGFQGWHFAEGLPWEQRDADLRAIFAHSEDAERLLDRYGVDYVVIGPFERDTMGANTDAYRSAYPAVIMTENYEVFAIDR